MLKKVEIFIDGSCIKNPGPGGYCSIIRYRKYEKILNVGYYKTTNNRMELMAAIVALKSLKVNCNIVLTTDSLYVQLGITQWIQNWKKHNWKTINNKLVKNIDLWQLLDIALSQHQIRWRWIKSHTNHIENERCDKLARTAAFNPVMDDVGYIY